MIKAVASSSSDEGAWYRAERQNGLLRLVVGGSWVISEAPRLDSTLRTLAATDPTYVEIDCGALERLDTVGAWLLLRTKRTFEHHGITVQPVNVRPEYRALVHTIDYECR